MDDWSSLGCEWRVAVCAAVIRLSRRSSDAITAGGTSRPGSLTPSARLATSGSGSAMADLFNGHARSVTNRHGTRAAAHTPNFGLPPETITNLQASGDDPPARNMVNSALSVP
jgi:hypothetical protein